MATSGYFCALAKNRQVSYDQNPSAKMVHQNHVRNYFWLGLSLANLHLPGF